MSSRATSRWRQIAWMLAALVTGCRHHDEPGETEPPAPEWPQVLEVGHGRPVRIEAIASQDGQRLVAYDFSTGSSDIAAITRTSSEGGLDPSFGVGGMRLLALDSSLYPDPKENRPLRMVVQADGRILVAGTSQNLLPFGGPASDLVVYRLTRDGALDDTFGAGGKATLDVGPRDELRGLALASEGKPVIAGVSWPDATHATTMTVARFNLDGTLDSSFGTNGVVTQQAQGVNAVNTLVIGALDGTERITTAGNVSNCMPSFWRFMPDGQLDPSFGTAGTFQVSSSSSWCSVDDLALQPDGKVVALGTQDPWVPLLIRLTPNGALDTSFQGGMVNAPSLGPNHFWRALALAPNGKLLAAAAAIRDLVVAAYNPDGTLATNTDTLLGSPAKNGILQVPGLVFGGETDVTTLAIETTASGAPHVVVGGSQDLRNQPNAVALEIDGGQGRAQLRWDGDSARGTGTSVARAAAVQEDGAMIVVGSALHGRSRDVVVVRLLPNGAPDPHFGDQGAVFIDNDDGDDDGHVVSLASDGKILVAGCGFRERGSTSVLLARLNPDGTPDSDFHGTGKVLLPAASPDVCAEGMALQPDGKIVIAGFQGQPSIPPWEPVSSYALLVARFNADGTPDTDFNAKAGTPLVRGKRIYGRDLVVHDDGTLTVVGDDLSAGDILVARFQADGTPGAAQTYDVAGGSDTVSGVRRMADGSLLLAGAVSTQSLSSSTFLARLRPDGSLDTGFGGNPRPGFVVVDLGQNLRPSSLRIDSEGRILVPVYSSTLGQSSDFAVARFDANGVLDPGFGVGGLSKVDVRGDADFAYGIAERPDGQLLLAGGTIGSNGFVSIGLALVPP